MFFNQTLPSSIDDQIEIGAICETFWRLSHPKTLGVSKKHPVGGIARFGAIGAPSDEINSTVVYDHFGFLALPFWIMSQHPGYNPMMC